jgi:hypothetical protein
LFCGIDEESRPSTFISFTISLTISEVLISFLSPFSSTAAGFDVAAVVATVFYFILSRAPLTPFLARP